LNNSAEDIVLSSVYAGNIDYYSSLISSNSAVIDVHEFFRKQSYRNRCVIAGANGPLNLIVPIQRGSGKTKVKDIKIDHSQNWKKIHWKSLESAYRTSPYFEYYEHLFYPVYSEDKLKFLMDLNDKMAEIILSCLQFEKSIPKSNQYVSKVGESVDYRQKIHPKQPNLDVSAGVKYIQVFEDKLGFFPNLSVLDLVFNEGPNAIVLLKGI
tara:strand:- start:480 stop:1109 length:630 start_codon:yes stop_codon:yes gene_type:complete